MKLVSDGRLFVPEIHKDLLNDNPWGYCENNHFVGQVVFSDELSTDINVPIYQFEVNSLLDEFIDSNEMGKGGNFCEESAPKAKAMIKDLEGMIERLKERMFNHD